MVSPTSIGKEHNTDNTFSSEVVSFRLPKSLQRGIPSISGVPYVNRNCFLLLYTTPTFNSDFYSYVSSVHSHIYLTLLSLLHFVFDKYNLWISIFSFVLPFDQLLQFFLLFLIYTSFLLLYFMGGKYCPNICIICSQVCYIVVT